jgi:hypothetical protein
MLFDSVLACCLASMQYVALTLSGPCRDPEQSINVKRPRLVDNSDPSARATKISRLKQKRCVRKIAIFYLQVIKPHGSRNIAAKFCERGPTLEEAKLIP